LLDHTQTQRDTYLCAFGLCTFRSTFKPINKCDVFVLNVCFFWTKIQFDPTNIYKWWFPS